MTVEKKLALGSNQEETKVGEHNNDASYINRSPLEVGVRCCWHVANACLFCFEQNYLHFGHIDSGPSMNYQIINTEINLYQPIKLVEIKLSLYQYNFLIIY